MEVITEPSGVREGGFRQRGRGSQLPKAGVAATRLPIPRTLASSPYTHSPRRGMLLQLRAHSPALLWLLFSPSLSPQFQVSREETPIGPTLTYLLWPGSGLWAGVGKHAREVPRKHVRGHKRKGTTGTPPRLSQAKTDAGDQGTQGHRPSVAFCGQQVKSSGGNRGRLYRLPSGPQYAPPALHIIQLQRFGPVARAGFWLH